MGQLRDVVAKVSSVDGIDPSVSGLLVAPNGENAAGHVVDVIERQHAVVVFYVLYGLVGIQLLGLRRVVPAEVWLLVGVAQLRHVLARKVARAGEEVAYKAISVVVFVGFYIRWRCQASPACC